MLDVSEDGYVLEDFPAKFEAGTLNIAGLIGLGASIDYMERIGIRRIHRHGMKMTEELHSTFQPSMLLNAMVTPKIFMVSSPST